MMLSWKLPLLEARVLGRGAERLHTCDGFALRVKEQEDGILGAFMGAI